MHEARFYAREPDGRLRCTLCPRDCRLADGQAGFCYIRQNEGGRMLSLGYGRSTGFASDPVEKKPLNHFHPGAQLLSFGTAGCNLGCRFCQNWDISRARLTDRRSSVKTAAEVCDLAEELGCRGLAFTYNDPVIWAEWAIDCAAEAKERGLATAFVTAGYVSPSAREEVFEHMDAANVDLKAFTEGFYGKVTLAHLAPVLDTLEWLAAKTKVWVEVTNLVIPGHNDDPAETRALAAWVRDHMGAHVPLHFTGFHPDYKMDAVPPTPPSTLSRAREIAREAGLHYVYTGNVHDRDGGHTLCPGCGAKVIERDWHAVTAWRMKGDRCAACGAKIAGVFDANPVAPTSGRRRVLGIV